MIYYDETSEFTPEMWNYLETRMINEKDLREYSNHTLNGMIEQREAECAELVRKLRKIQDELFPLKRERELRVRVDRISER